MNAIAEQISDWRQTIASGVGRFPVSLIALAIFAVFANLEIAGWYDIGDDVLFRIAALSGACSTIAAAMVLYGERRGVSFAARQALSLAAALVVGVAIWFWKSIGVSPPTLLVVCILALPLAPYLGASGVGFWSFAWRLIFAGALALAAVAIFCAGVSAILASLDYLFGLPVRDPFYGNVWVLGLGFVGPAFALALIPERFPDRDAPERSNFLVSSLLILVDFAAAPLIAVYALLLHAYALKILLSGELPKNQLGWLILVFGLATLALRTVAGPLGEIGRAPTRLFLKVWPLLLIVPLALLVFAVWERIAAYGLTPERYLLALFAIFLAIILLAQVDRRWRDDIRVIPVLGALALLFASFGPWGLVQASAAWQASRLYETLQSIGALDESGRLKALPAWEFGPASDVQSIVFLLDQLGELGRLRPLFEGRSDDPFTGETASSDLANQVTTVLKVDKLPYPEDTSGTFAVSSNRTTGGVLLGDYDLVVPDIPWNFGTTRTVSDPPILIEVTPTSMNIWAGEARVVVTKDMLRPAIDRRMAEMKLEPDTPQEPLMADLVIGGRKLGILIKSANGRSNAEAFELGSAWLDLFLVSSDWR
jgi:hypothetical protein